MMESFITLMMWDRTVNPWPIVLGCTNLQSPQKVTWALPIGPQKGTRMRKEVLLEYINYKSIAHYMLRNTQHVNQPQGSILEQSIERQHPLWCL